MVYSLGVPVDRKKIKQIRLKRGLTQEQAAERAKMAGRQHWNNIESGRQDSTAISVDLLERIASALEVKPIELLK